MAGSQRYPQTIKMPNGEYLTLYPISTVAEAVGRSVKTIRRWELAGIIPPSGFRDRNNARMYTEEQIVLITKCAEKAKINVTRLGDTTFSKKVYEGMKKLREEYKVRYFGGN